MKKILLGIIFLALFTACDDGDMPGIDGMWQLKTIEDTATHQTQPVDTIYFAFQRQAIFSYTVLHEKENKPATATYIYGYIDFPDNDHLHIQLDKSYESRKGDVLWKDTSVTYDIIQLNSKHLILSQNGSVYYFNKF